MNINELIEIFRESVSNFSKCKDDYYGIYYMGRVHAFMLVFNILYKQDLINGDTLFQLQDEWNNAFY